MKKREERFIETVWVHYKNHGRTKLPWRHTKDPYKICVSEIMLQQTQVDRVLPKYREFLKQFPSLASLASAPLGEVLKAWQGLGYNRRAKMLHQCAKEVVGLHKGRFPRTFDKLKKLSGIGPYTAGAIIAFAYNEPVPIIETNIRTVFIHHFFQDDIDIPDSRIAQLTELFLDKENPREWYWALMDYGSYLKKTVGNLNTRSKHYKKQSTFKGSDRQIRGAILRALSVGVQSRKYFHKTLPFEQDRIDAQLERLTEEGMIVKQNSKYTFPST